MDTLNAQALLQRTAELERELAAKNRELQLEAALDRVRTRAMAMERSDELKDLIAMLSVELAQLDFVLDRSFIIIFDPQTKGMTWWMSHPETPTEPIGLFIQYHEQPPFLAHVSAWEERLLQWQYILEGDVKRTWDTFLFSETELSQLPASVIANMRSKTKVYLSGSFNNFGGLSIATLEPLSQEQFDVLLRFAKVFDLTYTRFTDLKRAEAQAREAQIQLALERVRARTMAMQKSDELDETSMLLLRQLESLDISLSGIGIHIGYPDKPESEAWMWDMMAGKIPKVIYNHTHDRLSEKIYDGWKKGETLYVEEVKGEKLKDHLEYVSSLVLDPTIYEDSPPAFVFHIAYFTYGFFVLVTPAHRPTEHTIFIRFAKVFEQTYTRFLDLQRAEAQAREAQIETALEKIRTRTMAMQHSTELGETSFLLVKQIKALGIDVWGCAFNIFNEEENNSTEWFSNEEGYQRTYKLPREGVFLRYYEAAQRGESLHIEEFAGEKCAAHYRYLHTLPILGDVLKQYAEAGISIPTYQIDHVTYFKQGYLLFVTLKPVPESYTIFKRFAAVFEQTYTRFLDLQKAEAQAVRAEQDLIEIKAARKKAEDTLTDLKATQAQLIQKEKMASLGELTAGIAHEIQNPLNFVTNFSETNMELLQEAKTELKAGNTNDGLSLLDSIEGNEQKINQHGKRADSIVKGMLQHSRTSKGEKQLTDLNVLVDEYLRLAYYGFRAKDKSFSATIETHFDENIGKIDVVPQDLGRVLLNIYNNALYAVSDKAKKSDGDYEPTVTVTTKKLSNKIEIAVKDNGTGIPTDKLDKIFQPFFTTKPTGEGTGLGLSLSYDIVIAHGGELKVESQECEGTLFIVLLPLQ